MAGRKSKPTAMKELEDNPGKIEQDLTFTESWQ